MSDAAAKDLAGGAGQSPEPQPDLDEAALEAMSPEQVGAWVSRLKFAPVDADEAARLLATLPAKPADAPRGPVRTDPGRPLPPRRRAPEADHPGEPPRP